MHRTVSRGAVRSLLLAAALLAPGSPAAGQDAKVEAGIRARAAAGAAAARLAAFGEWCRGRNYRALAREQFQAALRLDPEEATARKGLGYRRVDDAWKAPAKPDTRPDVRISRSFTVDAIEKESAAAHGECAALYMDLAAWLVDRGMEDEAEAAFWTVVDFDPLHGDARRALGLEALDSSWALPRQWAPGALAKRHREMARSPLRPMPDPTDADGYPHIREREGLPTETREARFHARSSSAETGSRILMDAMLGAESVLTRTGAVPARDGTTGMFSYYSVGTRKQYESVIRMSNHRDEKWKESVITYGGCWWSPSAFLGIDSSETLARDSAAHMTAHFLTENSIPDVSPPAWYEEGAAYLASTAAAGTASTWCASSRGSAFRKELPDDADWDDAARTLVGRGEDPALSLLARSTINDIGPEGLVKARSVIAWMIAASPATLGAFLVATGRDLPPEAASRRVFGCPLEAVDRRWRMWARRP